MYLEEFEQAFDNRLGLFANKKRKTMSISFSYNGEPVATIDNIGMYSDNTPMVKTDQWAKICQEANTITIIADSLGVLMTGLFMVDAINHNKYGGDGITRLVLPYLPGARQDRTNPTGDVLFTARSIAKEINSRGFHQVISLDPHSPVMPSMIRNFVEYPLEEVAKRVWAGYTGIIAPDKGAKDRAERFAKAMGKSKIAYGSKTRDVSNGKITGFGIEGVERGGHYLIVDDICDGGGTFLGLGKVIEEAGAYAHLYVTHGLFKGNTTALTNMFKNVYTTDSIFRNREDNKIMTIKVVEDMEHYNV